MPSVKRRNALQSATAPHRPHDLGDGLFVGLCALDGLPDDGGCKLIDVLGFSARSLGHVPSIAGWARPSSLWKVRVIHYPELVELSVEVCSHEVAGYMVNEVQLSNDMSLDVLGMLARDRVEPDKVANPPGQDMRGAVPRAMPTEART